MKYRITKEDIAQLTDAQKKRLNELWLPDKYDVVLANICINAETEEYVQFEFVVGAIKLYHNHIILYDLLFLNEGKNSESESLKDDIDSYESDDVESDFSDDGYDSEYDVEDDGDFDFSFIRPENYNKEDCIPLLNIGQMIGILSNNPSKSFDFFLLADSGEFGVQLGSQLYNLSGYGSDFDSKELCDVLWECVKKIL
ncbi:MAG TPA: hypothetical protein PK033_07640 [Acetivibrio sp.]|jgi:hypothetical protein|nr:hypothetical protein [Clostridium sp.]HOQ38283.1 hypothetical protein [Acetivibrio sp.]HPT92097.1 hypothetical protein [Acetivibrio sp.]HQA57734.1 hypothetical protein [Acetivibrio sp.]